MIIVCTLLGGFLSIDKVNVTDWLYIIGHYGATKSIINLRKSQISPKTSMSYLGFELDTVECTIRVPIHKYEETMNLIRSVISQISTKLEISTLERIRVCSNVIIILILL